MSQALDFSINIEEYDFNKSSLDKNISKNIWVRNQWPIVYFIQNKNEKIAYVGESTNAYMRISNHVNNKHRQRLNRISIIGSDQFNKSATLDIESQLIQYIFSEGTYSLQNGNNGLSFHNYYQRSLYSNLFEEVWSKLLEKRIVSKTLKEIQNSNFFKYSPYKSLNQDQYKSVLEIIESLNKKDSAHIFVKGTAGTGKTILATYLMKLLNSNVEDLNTEETDNEAYREIELLKAFREKYKQPTIGLVIAMASLRKTLQNVFDKIPGLSSSMVISPSDTFQKRYDLLIVDEAHRLRQRKNISWMGVFTKNNKKLGLGNDGTELDWILANSSHQIFFYDSAQSVKPSDISHNRFKALLDQLSTIKLELKSQMRIKAGPDYITAVDNLLNCRQPEIKFDLEPLNYELYLFESFKELYSELTKKEKEFKLCRLVAGYSWPWISQKEVAEGKNYDIEIEEQKFYWNRVDKDWISSESSFKEVGCIHTTQGYDLNYAGVIFGREISYNPDLERIEINTKNYFDRNGKAGISNPEVLKEYIINIYKTMMYRGIKGTYIYACDENLRRYFRKYIPSFEKVKNLTTVSQGNELHVEKEKPFKILPFDKVQPFINSVPLYDIKVAAGNFSDLQQSPDVEWVEIPQPYQPSKDYFVCKVTGESMNKRIPNGSWCLFKEDSGGSREGKIVLVQHHKIHDLDFGSGYTIKSYHSEKEINEDGGWSHKSIVLKPLSTSQHYNEIVLHDEDITLLKVIGIFESVL